MSKIDLVYIALRVAIFAICFYVVVNGMLQCLKDW
jgi:hypothetical protein